MMRPLLGKTALITGASRGIGKAIAIELAQLGCNIVLNYVRNDEAAKQTKSELEQIGSRVLLCQANAGDPKGIDEMMELTKLDFGSLDILVHNAALGAFKPVHQLKLNQWELSMDVNAMAFLLLAQKSLPLMEKNKGGVMLAISSLGAHRFIPNYGAIGISKAALETLVKYLAVEFAPKNIRVNCVSGGLVDTDALKSFPHYEEFKTEVIKRTPAGRIALPQDLAKVVSFLTLPESGWIYGQTIVADGGLSLI